MTDFAPGDVVVKVRGEFLGMVDRVVEVDNWPGGCGVDPCLVLHLAKPHPSPRHSGWVADNFRKLRAADGQFTEQMRALRPAKVPATLSRSSENRNG